MNFFLSNKIILLLVMQTVGGRWLAEAAETLAFFTPVTGNKQYIL